MERMMSKLKKISLIIALIVVGAFAFLNWYKFHYSMDVAEPFEVTVQNPEHQLLIATQGSDFKNAVVNGVVDALKGKPVSIKVIDVSGLSTVHTDEWNAIVLLHTWESRKPQADAKQFLDSKPDLGKLVILSTSGGGDLKMNGIDVITSASRKSDIPKHISEIVQRINAVFT